MANDIFRRCGCRDENKKQYGSKCPKLAAEPKHGTWGFYVAAGIDPADGKAPADPAKRVSYTEGRS
ncbi:hypothetical protein ACTAQJ_08025 [Arthrobacter sp. alpha11c]